ncbi:GntR family transcriptional regulator [Streptomyces anulatus]|uniref:GntR family transcriptional regulator n=1 Tax=Streptomyces anulatus TaxID=1892 RepID=UPI001C2582C0|nr:GntR family transcriptional regulator [Streptomyces anulatus]
MTPPAHAATTRNPLQVRHEGQFTDAVAGLGGLLQDRGFVAPGSTLVPADLAHLTGHTPTAMSYALRQLASAGVVERTGGRWSIPDDRSREQSTRRARTVLEAMVDQGTYPPGSVLPSVPGLSFTLLTDPPALTAALEDLARRKVLQSTGRRYTVATRPRDPRPPHQFDVILPTRGHRRFPEAAGAPDRFTLQHLRDTARAQWENAEPLPAAVLAQREVLQRDLLRRLTLAARHHDGPPRTSELVRTACARAVATADCPMGTLGDRHWRYAVLATLLADLSDELTPAT